MFDTLVLGQFLSNFVRAKSNFQRKFFTELPIKMIEHKIHSLGELSWKSLFSANFHQIQFFLLLFFFAVTRVCVLYQRGTLNPSPLLGQCIIMCNEIVPQSRRLTANKNFLAAKALFDDLIIYPYFLTRFGSTRGTGFQTHSQVCRVEGLNP